VGRLFSYEISRDSGGPKHLPYPPTCSRSIIKVRIFRFHNSIQVPRFPAAVEETCLFFRFFCRVSCFSHTTDSNVGFSESGIGLDRPTVVRDLDSFTTVSNIRISSLLIHTFYKGGRQRIWRSTANRFNAFDFFTWLHQTFGLKLKSRFGSDWR
jgi:hypothetical protein